MRDKQDQKAVLYARVSSREQEKGYSIDAQIRDIYEYASKNGYAITEEFIDIESAGKEGRKEFTRMVSALSKSDDISAIIAHKLDRLYRNFKDYVTVDELRGQARVKTLYVQEEYADSAMGKFFEGFMVLRAKNYLDNLSEEVKKGRMEKLKQGGFPGYAPIGYINDRTTKAIYVDDEKSPYIRKAFELYATGRYSLEGLSNVLYEMGFRSRSGKKVYKNSLHLILSNSIYYGKIRDNGMLFDGSHAPIIDKKLFDKAQEVLNTKSKPKEQKHSFHLRGFLTCAVCGHAVTAEIQKGHTYYHCAKPKCESRKPYAREDRLDEQVVGVLKGFSIDDAELGLLLRATREQKNAERSDDKTIAQSINRRLLENGKKLENLIDARIKETDETMVEFYEKKRSELLDERAALQRQLSPSNANDERIFEQMEGFFKFANSAVQVYSDGSIEEKQRVLSLTSSNLLLKNGLIASYQVKEPFNILASGSNLEEFENLLGHKDSN